MSHTSVQFTGIDAALRAYEHKDVPAWALFVGSKQLLFKYEGDSLTDGLAELESALNMIVESKATYTLKVYEDLPAGGKIKDNTPADGSFNFRLTTELPGGQMAGRSDVYLAEQIKELREQNKQILDRLAIAEGDTDENGEQVGGVNNIMGTIQQIMSIPGVADVVGGIVRSIGGALVPQRVGLAGTAAAIDAPIPSTDDQAQLERVISAYLIIREGMPGALDLLEKLAMMYQTDRAKFEKIKAMISFAI